MTGIFHEYFLNQYTQVKIINEDYLWYLLRWRVMPLALAVCVANLGFRRLTATGILLWTGFAAGILSVAAVLRMGLCGMLLCIAGIFCNIFLCTGISSIDPVLLSLSAK